MTFNTIMFPLNQQAGTAREHRFISHSWLLNDVLSVPALNSKIPAYFLLNAGRGL